MKSSVMLLSLLCCDGPRSCDDGDENERQEQVPVRNAGKNESGLCRVCCRETTALLQLTHERAFCRNRDRMGAKNMIDRLIYSDRESPHLHTALATRHLWAAC